MKKILYIILCAAILVSCGKKKEVYMFTSFNEPAIEGLRMLYSENGLEWHELGCTLLSPKVGSEVMRDPSIVRGKDGIYHLVWTSGWSGDKGFGYASSKDLITWSDQQFIEVMGHEPETVNVWAPELFYDDQADQFIIIWASTIPFRFEKGMEEERNNHRMYYVTTKDFKTFSEAKLFFDPGFSVIDAVIVKMEGGKYALVLKDNTRPNRNLRMAFATSPTGPYTEISEPFTEQLTEGPTVVKLGSDYYVYYDAYRDKTYGAVKTKNFKTFIDATGEISIPLAHKHGTIFKADRQTFETLQEHCVKVAAEKKEKEELTF